ncbi:MAG: DUF5693 family protein [Clostridia bacterium]|nr:DUF5693 family protein [Clostridia bacterium]
MKNKTYCLFTWCMIVVLCFALLPTVFARFRAETTNQHVVVSYLLDENNTCLPLQQMDAFIEKYQSIGVNTLTIQEKSLSALENKGLVKSVTYSELLQDLDDESMAVAAALENAPRIAPSSLILMGKRDAGKAFLTKAVPLRYAADTYGFYQLDTLDVFCFWENSFSPDEFFVGYDESEFQYAAQKNMAISMCFVGRTYDNAAYLEEMNRLIQTYHVQYLNLKGENTAVKENNRKQSARLAEILQENNMTLLLTETKNQISNQMPADFADMIKNRAYPVARAFETNDFRKEDATQFSFRYYQFLNSLIDRNLRFFHVTRINAPGKTAYESAEDTFEATKRFTEKLQASGYTLQPIATDYADYSVNTKLSSGILLTILGICMLYMVYLVFGKPLPILTICMLLAIPFTLIVPDNYLALYPSVFAALFPCFLITVVFWTVRRVRNRFGTLVLLTIVFGESLIGLCLVGYLQGAALAGADYYLNIMVFRGTKLALLFPILYSIPLYYWMFIKKDGCTIWQDIKKLAKAKISVYQIGIIAIVALALAIYILRSGSVQQISSMEYTLRNRITDIFTIRPRTKEFLIGYPCLFLFVYSSKKAKSVWVPFLFAAGSALLFASVMNSFCHVFTNLATIYLRTVYGAAVGVLFGSIAIALAYLIFRCIRHNQKL